MREKSLNDRIVGAVVWLAAFSFACGIFLSLTMLLRWLPPTSPVAVGLVTIEEYSKLRDYVAAALFFLLVPPLTIGLQRWIGGEAARQSAALAWRGSAPAAVAGLSFALPFLLSPLFYLTTGKAGWVLFLPVALAYAAPRLLRFGVTRLWVRQLFAPSLRPFHALLFCEAVSWLLFRYLVTGRRIAHIPTLFLEVVFATLFLALFWAGALLLARLWWLTCGEDPERAFRRITTAGLPIVILPFLAAIFVPLPQPRLWMIVALLLTVLLARSRRSLAPGVAWRVAALFVLPAIIYLISYASTAQLSQWIDLFHRGETLGPASDYLRGKVPFRDVFALHGMLEDGLLDAWLMQLFGRSVAVAIGRTVILGALLPVAIWFLGLVVFDSIPLALLCVAMGSWTTTENNRTLLQVAAVALFWYALRRRSRTAAVLSGVIAGVAIFFSYDIGLYTIVGALAAAVAIAVVSRRTEWNGLSGGRAALWFGIGVVAGSAPFLAYLGWRGALGEFALTSFVTIPKIIDAVWSLPFPDLVSTFRNDLNLHTLSDFILWEKFHLILSPLAIGVAAVYLIVRWLRRRLDLLDFALLVIAMFAAVTQRTAFGRAEFRHQYFAAFLIGPMLVLLAVILLRAVRPVWRSGDEGVRAFLAAVGVAAVPVIVVVFWIPDLVNQRIEDFVHYYARVLHVQREEHAEEVGWRIDDVSRNIRALTPRGEPMFDFSNQPAFYFFANRPNPTRFYQVPILSPREFQAETIRALEKSRTKVVLRRSPELFDQFDGVSNDLRAQAVAAYINDTYRFFRNVRGVELWTRIAGARPRPLNHYLALIRVPPPEVVQDSASSRMVFPVVGTIGGYGGALWRSDLTLHNPYRQPMQLRLRYVANGVGADRAVSLAPRKTQHWEDVAGALFGMQNTIGTLWIEHRQGRPPVAVVKTSDVAHAGRSSVEKPLTASDAAAAGTDTGELAIVGVPAARPEGRRINLGVVNVGTIPATFRISARSSSGRTVGRSVESGVPEGEVWLVGDIERALGVPIDESMTVRISVIAGTGVAYATIVEANNDSEFVTATPAQQ